MRLRARVQIAAWGVLLLAASAVLCAQDAASNPAALCASKNQLNVATVTGFVFKTYQTSDGACLQVLRGNKVIFRRTEPFPEAFTLGQPGDASENIPAIANGADLTGRGHPDMIVSEFSGGAHCCMSHMVFELEPKFKLLATLNDADDDLAHFKRDARDHRYHYITADWTFAYWPNCFACSPSESVILRWADDAKGGGFHLALDQMRTPAPNATEWNERLSAARAAANRTVNDTIGRTLWQSVLDLIYSGHSELAWKFVDAAGPRAQQKPFPALADFCALLKQSPYWPDLQPTLVNVPPACAATLSRPSK